MLFLCVNAVSPLVYLDIRPLYDFRNITTAQLSSYSLSSAHYQIMFLHVCILYVNWRLSLLRTSPQSDGNTCEVPSSAIYKGDSTVVKE